jgi:hypothetical protein
MRWLLKQIWGFFFREINLQRTPDWGRILGKDEEGNYGLWERRSTNNIPNWYYVKKITEQSDIDALMENPDDYSIVSRHYTRDQAIAYFMPKSRAYKPMGGEC